MQPGARTMAQGSASQTAVGMRVTPMDLVKIQIPKQCVQEWGVWAGWLYFYPCPGDHSLSSQGIACQLHNSEDSPWFVAGSQAPPTALRQHSHRIIFIKNVKKWTRFGGQCCVAAILGMRKLKSMKCHKENELGEGLTYIWGSQRSDHGLWGSGMTKEIRAQALKFDCLSPDPVSSTYQQTEPRRWGQGEWLCTSHLMSHSLYFHLKSGSNHILISKGYFEVWDDWILDNIKNYFLW